MKLYCVYGMIDWEGEYNHTYFFNKRDADSFKELWEGDMRYMDNILSVEVEVLPSMQRSELIDILSKINK